MITEGTREAFDRLKKQMDDRRAEKLARGEGTNLLKETIEKLYSHDKTPQDVLYVVSRDCKATWEDFVELADFEYDAGYGGAEIDSGLYIVGDNWWLERHEYDGSEWWEFKTLPKAPAEFTHSLIIRERDDEVAVKPKTEEDMIAFIKRDVLVMDNGTLFTTKEYLKGIKWFYEKYKLLFDGE
jgi:hypothetical protein